jgi:hypothetical protein
VSNSYSLDGSITNGIVLTSGGSYQSPFTIDIDGTINTTGGYGVYSHLSPATLINQGAVTAGICGVFLKDGGAFTNSGSASSIYGAVAGVEIRSTPATLINNGTIASKTSQAVYVLGGTITNAAGATISSQNDKGFYAYGSVATTLINAGLIISEKTDSSMAAVYIQQAGYITNSESGVISGIIGVHIAGQGNVLNSGTILGTSTYGGDLGREQGVELGTGYVSNSASGVISGGQYGIRINDGSIYNAGSINGQYGINLGNGSIYNIGTVTGAALFLNGQVTVTNAYGGSIGGEIAGFGTLNVYNAGQVENIDIHPGGYGYVSNASTGTINNAVVGETSATLTVVNDGLIQGGRGIYLQGGGTVTNAGTINNQGGNGVYLGGTGTNELIVEAGGEVYGAVVGGPSSTNILSLAASSGGTIETLSGFQTINLGTGATWSLSGDQAGLATGEIINGFAAGDQVTITDFAATTAAYVAGVGVELISAGSTITIDINGNLSNSTLLLANNGTASIIGDETNGLSTAVSAGITLAGIGSYGTSFTITQTGTVDTAGAVGVYSTVSPATLINQGYITAATYGVLFTGGGYVSNGTTGLIDSYTTDVEASGQGATVVNAGNLEISGTAGTGIDLVQGGQITNMSTGTISTNNDGSGILGSNISVINDGIITDNRFGINAYNVYISNNSSGSIYGALYGIYSNGSSASIVNAGSIGSSDGDGVYLKTGGQITNVAGGTISAALYAAVGGTGVSVVNDGIITGGYYGIFLNGGSISNNASGNIYGSKFGIFVQSGAPVTIINAGDISGQTSAIILEDGGNKLIVDPGAAFTGHVGGADAGNLLELASGSTAGTIDSDNFSGFTTIDIDEGARWTLTGTNGELADDVSAAATVSLAANSTLDVTGNIDADQNIVFAGDNATLEIDINATIDGTIDLDTTAGDRQTIDITGLSDAPGNITFQSFDTSTDVLTLGYVGDPPETLTFSSGDAAHYMLASDGSGGTDVVIPCFVTNTRILTTRGYLPVQNLCVGDRAVTVRPDGPASAEIIWLGSRTVNCERLSAPEKAWPILVSQGALGPAMPFADLWLSPEHCIVLDGVMIPVKELVNGRSIRHAPRATVTYWHVELTAHDVMLAEGLPAESYLDTGNRAAFTEDDVGIISGKVHHWSDKCLPIAFGREALAHFNAHLARHGEATLVAM